MQSVTEPSDAPGGPQGVTSYVYDAAGRLASVTDPRGRVTAYAYDGRNRVTGVTYNDGSVEIHGYGAGPDANLRTSHTDRLGNVTLFHYDAAGREAEKIEAFGKSEAASRSCSYLAGTDLKKECVDRGERTTYSYDDYNRLVGTTVQPNVGTLLTDTTVYDQNRRVDHRVDRYGRKTFQVYDVNDRVVRTVRETVPGGVAGAPAGLPRVLTPNAPYLIEDVVYDAEGQVLSRIDGRGIASTSVYDARGRVIRAIEAAGTPEQGKTEYDYDAQGNRLRVRHPRHFTEPGGFVTEYAYTGRNLLSSMTAAKGRLEQATESYGYDLDRKRSVRVDGRGFGWNTLWSFCCGNHQAEIEPAADVDGDAATPPTRAITVENRDSLGHVTHGWVAGDASLFPDEASLADPGSTVREMTTRYDGRYRPIARTVWMVELGAVDENAPPIAGDPGYPAVMGLTTRWVYDDDLTDGVGLDVVYAGALAGLGLGVGSDGMAVEETNPAGEKRVTVQDGLGRVIRSVDGVGNVTGQTYDSLVAGAPGTLVETAAIDGPGHVTRTRVDGGGRKLASVDALGHATVAAYDAENNQVSVRDPNGIGHDAVFDARNRETTRTDTAGDSTGRVYDAGGNVVAAIDGLGSATIYAFDARDRKVAVTDRIGGITTFGYDENGNLLQIVDAEGSATTYTYEERNLLLAEEFPPGQQTGANGGPNSDVRVYGYDAGRRLLTRLDQAGVVTSYGYDRADRLVVRAYPDGLNDTFAYDPANRLTDADSGRYAVQVERSYDAAGRLLSDTQTIDGTAYVVSHGYDADNRVVQINYPNGSVVQRGYTDRNELASVTLDGQAVASRFYDAGGLLTTTALGNGLVETRTYKPGDRLVQTIQVPGVTDFGYTYDADKRKLAETDGILPANGQSFGYDGESRLTSWARTDGVSSTDTQAWNLTTVGDWASTTRNGVAENRSHTPVHEVIAVGGAALGYDAKGNLTVDERGQSYTWDVENRLEWANVPATGSEGGKVASYRYDALGRRVQKAVNGEVTRFVLDGAQVVVEYDLSAAAQRAYVYGSYVDEPLAVVVLSAMHFCHAKRAYSIVALTDAAASVVEKYRYNAFGQQTILSPSGTTRITSTIGNQIGFTGRYLDKETGLLDFRSRMYQSALGRFVQRDGLGHEVIELQNNFSSVAAMKWKSDRADLRMMRIQESLRKSTEHASGREAEYLRFVIRGWYADQAREEIEIDKIKSLMNESAIKASGYIDGLSLYAAYYVPNSQDPSGHGCVSSCMTDWGVGLIEAIEFGICTAACTGCTLALGTWPCIAGCAVLAGGTGLVGCLSYCY